MFCFDNESPFTNQIISDKVYSHCLSNNHLLKSFGSNLHHEWITIICMPHLLILDRHRIGLHNPAAISRYAAISNYTAISKYTAISRCTAISKYAAISDERQASGFTSFLCPGRLLLGVLLVLLVPFLLLLLLLLPCGTGAAC
jgi:hypothetical protein